MPLISLVYVSVAEHAMEDAELDALLDECRRKNEPIHVTGMLLYRSRFFIQALEGEADIVEPLYEAIAQDPRHIRVTLVHKGTISQRSFPSWSMGFRRLSEDDAKQVPGFTEFLNDNRDLSFFVDTPSRAAHLLDIFKEGGNY